MSVALSPSISDVENRDLEALKDRIQQALSFAKNAVEQDQKGDYYNAAINYRTSVEILESDVSEFDQANLKTLNEMVNQYKNRAQMIDNALATPARSNSGSGGGTIPLVVPSYIAGSNQFKFEVATGSMPEAPPLNSNFKPYWLMRLFAKTMQTGAYFTPKIYVPKSVWFQDGSRFAAINTKLESLAAINEPLIKMKDLSYNDPEAVRELDNFCTLLGPIQNSLAKQLYFIPDFKEEKEKEKKIGGNFGHAFKKMVGRVRGREKLDDSASYILLLLEVFENSQFLEKWMAHYLENQNHMTQKLRRISEFYLDVICSFVLKDLVILLTRYVKNAKLSFERKEDKSAKKEAKDSKGRP